MPTSEEAPDEIAAQLLRVRAGSREALGAVLELARRYLLGVANREFESSLQAKAGASDLVQETFLEAQRIFDRFEGQTASELVAWLRGILLNKMAELNRHYIGTEKRRVDREVSLEVTAGRAESGIDTPSGCASEQEQTELLRQHLARLPEHYRQVLVWREWDGLTFEEIGRRLGKSPDAVRMLWYRALEQLQKEMRTTP